MREKDSSVEVHKLKTGKKNYNNSRKEVNKPSSSKTAETASATPAKVKNDYKCKRCGRNHEKGQCPAWGQTCNKCNGKNHFAACCTAKSREAETKVVQIEKKVFSLSGNTKTKTFTVCETRKKITFQIDTGAESNVIPMKVYGEVTGDKEGSNLVPDNVVLILYDKRRIKSRGTCYLKVESNGTQFNLKASVADLDSSPLLSSSTSEQMGLVSFHNCDQVAQAEHIHTLKGKDKLISEFQDVFTGLGTLEGEYKITLDEAVSPVIHAPRRVPVAIRDELKALLDQMEKDGVIAKVTIPTKWVSSLMLKREPNKLRICLDPQDLNRAIQREHHPLPTVEEVATRLKNARVFSVLDAKRGFWQVVLEEQSSYLTTFNTPFGRYRWRRMPFGISSAPEVFQRKMMEFAENLEGVEVVADDFLVVGYGNNDKEAVQDHDKNLRKFLEKARKANLKLNGDKLKLRLDEVPFIGHVLTKEGIKPDPRKIKAVMEMPRPEDELGTKRFLGMVQYLAKFLPHLTNMTKPLRQMQGDVNWKWTQEQETAFKQIKDVICKAPVLVYYDVSKQVTIQCDASQAGLGAVLLQEGKPVAFTSRAMTPTEQRYAQIEKEMLAIVHAAMKFDQYIYGRQEVKVESDHKPLETIFKKSVDSCPRRLQRMLLALQKYSLKVEYKRGKDLHIADTLSRAYLPHQENIKMMDILEVKEQTETKIIQSITALSECPNSERRMEEIRQATHNDPQLQSVIKFVREGWPEKTEVPHELKPYYNIKEELTEETGLLFKGTRVVIPRSLRADVMNTIHESHMGIEGTLRRAREYVYWPCMNKQLKDKISKCDVCNEFRSQPQKETLKPYPVPERAWCNVSADLFEYRKEMFLIVVDHYSNYFEYDRITSVTSENIIFSMKSMFSRLGIPEKLITDNGRQFVSSEFRNFARKYEFDHVTSSPHFPQSNGKAENAVKTCKMLMKKALQGKEDFFLALLDYRNTPAADTGLSPSQKLFGRRTRTLLPIKKEKLLPQPQPNVKERLEKAKEKQKQHFDKGAKDLKEIKPGDTIRMKLPGSDRWSKGKCIRMKGERSYVVEVSGKTYVRNRRHLIKTDEAPPGENAEDLEMEDDPNPDPPVQLRRSTRIRRAPNRLGQQLN